ALQLVVAADRVEPLVGLRVHARDEEGRHGGDAREVGAAGLREALDAAQVGLRHLAVALEGEDQRDVARDAGGDRLLDRGQPLGRGGDLDEEVGPVDHRVEALGLLDRALRVVREPRVDLERHPPVTGVVARLVPLRAEDVARAADVLDGEREEDLLRVALLLQDLAELVVVGVALGDRRLEDRRIGGDAVHALVDERLEVAVAHERARQEVDPDALSVVGELLQGSGGHGYILSRSGFLVARKAYPGSPGRESRSGPRATATVSERARRHACGKPTRGGGGFSGRGRTARAARRPRRARPGAPRAAGPPGPGW